MRRPNARVFYALLPTFALAGMAGHHLRRGPQPLDVYGLAARLEEQGLRLRVVPVPEGGSPAEGAWLTVTAKNRDQLSLLSCARPKGWRGTVLCLPEHPGVEDSPPLRAGRFRFWGDPELLSRIRKAFR
jgi:hypothetical protein